MSDSPLQSFLRDRRALALAVVFIVGLCAFFGWQYRQWSLDQWAERTFGPAGRLELTVERGRTLTQIASQLEATKVIDNAILFQRYATSQQKERKLQAGEYRFTMPASPGRILADLQHGTFQRSLTVPEGWSARQIEAALIRDGWADADGGWPKVIQDPEGIGQIAAEGLGGLTSVEGFCFPETYFLEQGTSLAAIRNRMIAQFNRVWAELSVLDRDPRAAKLTVLEVVTLASMVQREARSDAEMPQIASVYLNRLDKGMRMQCCATVHYALGEVWNRPLRYRDLKVKSPYNTYRNDGLPPGPISNPGRAALRSVVQPEATDFLFYVYKGDGKHHFTRTYREHRRAAKKYGKSDPTAKWTKAKPDRKLRSPG